MQSGVAWRGAARRAFQCRVLAMRLARERLDVVGGQQAVLAGALDGAVHPALGGRLAAQYHVTLLHAQHPVDAFADTAVNYSTHGLLYSNGLQYTRTQWPSHRAYIERDFVRVGRAVRVDGAEERLLR